MKRLELHAPPTTGGPVLLAALVAASLIITTVWYREGVSGPLHAVRSGMMAVAKPFQLAGNALTMPFRAASNWVSGTSVSRDELDAVTAQNIRLKERLAQLEEARLENERVRALVKFAQAQDLESVGARVIGRPTQTWEGSMVIDRGSADGVRTGAPVIAAGGLVGQVVAVSPWSAKVRLVTDPDSGVAVVVQRTRAGGVVRGDIEGGLSLEFVDKSRMPRRGDVLITSGLGGVYPKGLVVGEVTDVAAPQADLYPIVAVTSRVALDRIEEVLVITSESSSEQPGGGE